MISLHPGLIRKRCGYKLAVAFQRLCRDGRGFRCWVYLVRRRSSGPVGAVRAGFQLLKVKDKAGGKTRVRALTGRLIGRVDPVHKEPPPEEWSQR